LTGWQIFSRLAMLDGDAEDVGRTVVTLFTLDFALQLIINANAVQTKAL
jgi:hypothetical protein